MTTLAKAVRHERQLTSRKPKEKEGKMAGEETTIVAISGIQFPTASRQYLINLVRDVAVTNGAHFIVVAGHTIDGKALERSLKDDLKAEALYLKEEAMEAKRESKEAGTEFDRSEFQLDRKRWTNEFVEEQAKALSEYLPRIEGVNWHFVIAEKVFDRPIGAQILEQLRKIRSDVRILGRKEDGSYDAEVKVPIERNGGEEIRVIVPRKTPWFYRIITGLMQRLISSFVSRTHSPKPALILVGCTGTDAYLPFYEGVPCISVPTLHRLDEQLSTENMVGCGVIKISGDKGQPRVRHKSYDFRTVVSKERELSIPSDATKAEKDVLNFLKTSAASAGTLLHRLNSVRRERGGKKKKWDEAKLKEVLEKLRERSIVTYQKSSNQYTISEQYSSGIDVRLSDMLKDTRVVRHAVTSCFHGGALKTLYYTALQALPNKIWQADAWFEVGDVIQGLAHNYDRNGEVLPITNGFDKQEILTAAIRARNILDIFRLRLKALNGKKVSHEELLQSCLITYVLESGNHPEWIYYNKDTLVLHTFESELKDQLISGIIAICEEKGIHLSYELVRSMVQKKFVRVGENKIVNIDGVVVGVKHPHKGRTQNKSHRVQDVADYTWRAFEDFFKKRDRSAKGFSLVYVANFHEGVAVHVPKFGRTVLGVMTGTYSTDTRFETNMDKVVDTGHAMVTACLNKDGLLIWSEVEYVSEIHPDDERIILADRIKTSDVLALSADLTKIEDLPWR